jgi:6-phosphogluconolactonase
MTGRVEISADPKHQAEFVANWLLSVMDSSPGNFRLVLSGGNTPHLLYRALVQPPYFNQVPWRRLQLFWGDERFVSHDDPDSNFAMAFATLLRHAPIPPERVHPIPVNGTPEDAAARYEATLRTFQARDQAGPLFDVVLLGMGADGHTASLLPESPVLDEQEHWVAAVDHGRPQARITLTYPAIASSRKVAFLVSGAEKQSAVLNAIAGKPALPAARVRSEGEVIWFLDRAAAGPLYQS